MAYNSVIILGGTFIITDCKAVVKMIMAVDPYKHTGDCRVLRTLHRFSEPRPCKSEPQSKSRSM